MFVSFSNMNLGVNNIILSWIEVELQKIRFFSLFHRRHFMDGLNEAMYHPIDTDTIICYKDIYKS